MRFLKHTAMFPENWDKIIDELCKLFKEDNPRFSEAKFKDYIDR